MTASLIGVPNKRVRRTRAEIESLWEAMAEELAAYHPQSVRHVYYRMVVRNLVAKTEAGYDTAQTQLVKMRRAGVIPYDWITDGTRWARRVKTYGSPAAAVAEVARLYRRNVWEQTLVYLEVWCESDSIAGVIVDVTAEYAVPLFPAKGFSGLGFLYPSARGLEHAANGRPAHVLYVGDWDPSGKVIPEKIEAGLREHAPAAEIHFRRLAVNPDQISSLDLPSKPPKASDSRAKRFTGDTVEAEAIPVETMQQIVRDAIEGFIEPRILTTVTAAEKSERQFLRRWAARLEDWPALRWNIPDCFAILEMPGGSVIRDIAINQKGGRGWAGLPAQPVRDRESQHISDHEGRREYATLLSSRDRNLAAQFSEAVIALMREQHPDDLGGGQR